ncbi:unnamed protein product, partial [marine sediment metagenome]
FVSRLSLTLMTGVRARNLDELLRGLKELPDSVIYHHTHRFLVQHQHLVPEPPNDFAFWVSQSLSDRAVGEALASVNTVRFASMRELRDALIKAVERNTDPQNSLQNVHRGQEFYFMRSVAFLVPTNYQAWDLVEFKDALGRISVHSLYHHIFEGRLHLPGGMDDFANWLKNSLEETALAKKLSKMDPYTHTLEGMRSKIIGFVEHRISELSNVPS